jgi:DNA-binding transcriptional LysR family regulator
MKIQNLRFFVSVMRCGSITEAAQQLRLSQPTVSTGLKLLEQELGQPLFERSASRRRMVPTAKAVEFLEHASEILKRCDMAITAFRAKEQHRAHIRIGVLRTISSDTVTAALAKLSSSGEQTYGVREGGTDQLARWLRQGRIELAWTTVAAKMPNAQILWEEPFVCLASRNHPLARRPRRAKLKDLEGEALVLRGSCELKAGKLHSAGVRMRIAARVERDDLALRLVAQGIGVAFAPQSLATSEVVPVPIADLALARTIGLRWRSELDETLLERIRTAVLSFGSVSSPRKKFTNDGL